MNSTDRPASYLQSIIKACKDLVFVFNAEGEIVDYLKPENSELLYVSSQEFMGKPHHEVLPSHVSIKIQEAINALNRGEDKFSFDYNLTIGGRNSWFSAIFSVMHENGSTAPKYLCVIREITRRKEDELLLQETLAKMDLYRKQMDLFFTQSLTGFFFVMLDKPITWDDTTDKAAAIEYALDHSHFTRVNNALLKQYNATYEQLTSRTLRDFVRNDIETGRQLMRQLYDEKHIHINRVTSRLDGTEVWFEGDYICFVDDNNKITGHFGTQRDVTERKHAEEKLQASEARYRLLADNMLDMVALHDADGTYRYVSPSVKNILGFTPEELIGTNPYTLFNPEDIDSINQQSHQKALEGIEITNMEYRIRKKDGTYVWFSTNTKPIKDQSGKVTMLQTISRNVTEKIETLHQLEQLNQQKNQLFSIIAHDLRGPIANFMSILQLTQHKHSEEDHQRYLKLLLRSSINLFDLLEDLLTWSSNQLNKTTFDPSEVDLQDEIDSMVRRLSEMASTKNITVKTKIPDQLPSVFADRNMVNTMLRNLISNAIKFTKPGGQIEIGAQVNEPWVEVYVKDNGTGIKKEDIQKLLTKNSTFSTYGTNGEKGTGLGFEICKDFAQKQGGKIWIESEFGSGSKFTFSLPRY